MTPLLAGSPTEALRLLSFASSFFISTCLAFVAVWLAALAIRSAAARFVLWMAYLAGCCVYWICGLSGAIVLAGATRAPAPPLAAWVSPPTVMVSPDGAAHLWSVASLALYGYAVVLGCVFAVGLWQRVRLCRLLSRRREAGPRLVSAAGHVAVTIGAPPAHVWLLEALPSPASTGWFRPAIYLPVPMEEASEQELASVLLHEFFHLRRMDALWDDVGRFCRAILLFHPLAYCAFAFCRMQREFACDQSVLRHSSEDRELYAQLLLGIGWAQMQPSGKFGIRFGAAGSLLKRRVRRILTAEPAVSLPLRLTRTSTAVMLVLAAAMLLPSVWIRFSLRPSPVYASVVAPIATAQKTHFTLRGRLHRHSAVLPAQPVLGPVPKAATVIVPASVAAVAHAEPRPHYRLEPSADAPLFDPPSTSDPGATGSYPVGTLPGRGRYGASNPSLNTVVSDAVSGLERVGGGHERDHDRD